MNKRGYVEPVAGDTSADTKLLSIEQTLGELEEAWSQKQSEIDRLDEALPAWAKLGPDNCGNFSIDLELDFTKPGLEYWAEHIAGDSDKAYRLSTRPSVERIKALRGVLVAMTEIQHPGDSEKTEKINARFETLLKAHGDRIAERDALLKQAGAAELEAETVVLSEQRANLFEAFCQTPASSISGVATKLRDYVDFIEVLEKPEEERPYDEKLIVSLFRDVERLANGAA